MEKYLFILLRTGLELSCTTVQDRECLNELTSTQWQQLIELAERHGVGAIAFDGFQKIFAKDSQPLDMDTLMDWLGQTSYLEQRNEQQIDVMKDLCGRMVKNVCTVMLMKGQANALYYPKPNHRAVGDIDIYMFNTYKRGNKLAADYGAKVDTHWYKHSQIHYRDEMFENHLFFVATRDGMRSKKLDKALQDTLRTYKRNLYPESEIILPPVEFNAKFMTYHALTHFVLEGLHLKQVLDWVMFLKKEQNNIDWKDLYAFCEKFHLRRFLDVMNDIAINKFGIKIDNPQVVAISPYTEKVLHSILYDDDFVFSSGGSSWQHRWHLIANMWKYRWKYNEIYQMSIFKRFYFDVSGFLFHTESEACEMIEVN